eukprot:Plantae.Rhodophyta-Purpureofilum_apyrenoidigerum.ctg4374.p1 GENE.Plantae.Rhodophyta-Purpureofilum_apyrenoidigerum.ctg4374~~Plantae.Rhodophyta-Purpureofilum_apyrenoidigerum.ctg4374.p1  ORF type:complete len:227 (+),score=25.49 Plantae.Rhodophyta-Purpureofilum_apyrenoidigerum.ctg4374:112-792(+)
MAGFVNGLGLIWPKEKRRTVCLQEKLLEPIWTESNTSASMGTFTEAPMWRFLIASDGHPVQHMKLLTRGEVQLRIVSVNDVGVDDSTPEFVRDVPQPTLHREIELVDSSGTVFLFASSWWNRQIYRELVNGYTDLPVWEIFARTRFEIARKIEKFHFGYNKELEDRFHTEGPFYAREYCFKRERTPMVRVYEIFSPKLQQYIGPMTVPRQLGGGTVEDWRKRTHSS